MKKRIRILILAAVILLLAMSCGKKSDGETATDSSGGAISTGGETLPDDGGAAQTESDTARTENGGTMSKDSAPAQIWTTAEQPVRVRYDRMWAYSDYAETSDPALIAEIVDAVQALTVGEKTDEVFDDYTDILTFTFADGGMIRLEFEEQNWVAEDHTRYHVEGLSRVRELLEAVLSNKDIEAEKDMKNEEPEEAMRPVAILAIEANGHVFYAEPEDNSSAEALVEKLSSEPVELELHDYGGFEKVGALPWELPRNDESITTEPGDVILYQGDQITIYYDENTWDFTRLAKIEDVTKEELLSVFGEGNVTVKFRVEWSE